MGISFSQLNTDELNVIIDKGCRAQEFNESIFGKEINKDIKKEIDLSSHGGEWHPGMPIKVEDIAIVSTYNSGLKEGLRKLKNMTERLVVNKEEALKEIHKREKLKKEGNK